MKPKRTAALLAALCLALAACAAPGEADGRLRLWFPAAPEGLRPASQAVRELPFDGEASVDALMAGLLAGPGSDTAASFPPGLQVLGWSLEAGLLRLNLSDAYNTLSGVDLTLADSCIVLTLCQLEQVSRVCITVDGGPVAARERQVLSPEDLIFSGAEEQPRQVIAVLYFPRALGKGLGFEYRELTLTEDDDRYTMIAQALLAGPTDADLRTLLPGEDALLDVWTDGGVCFVNFSSAFLSAAPESETERNLMLYSVVDTLGNQRAVDAVQLLVDGERVPAFGGVETGLPLEPDFGLLGGG